MNIPLKCKCGEIQGEVSGITLGQAWQVICYCGDCQTFPRYLGNSNEILDANGGSLVLPVYPVDIKFTHGLGNLKSIKLSSDGITRWFAGCCKTPVANTINGKLPFANIFVTMVDLRKLEKNRSEALGSDIDGIYGKFAIGKLSEGTPDSVRPKFIFKLLKSMAKGFLLGKVRPSPFFDPVTNKPICEPIILSDETYDKLRYGHLPIVERL